MVGDSEESIDELAADDACDVVVGSWIEAELWQKTVVIALNGGGLAVSQHVESARYRVFAPRQTLFAHRSVVEVGPNGVYRQPFNVIRGLIVQKEAHPKRVVVGEQARVQIGGVWCVQSLMLAERHFRPRHHCHRIVVDVCHDILGPPFGSQLDALETIAAHICLHEVSLIIGVEGVELVSHQTLNVRGVTLLGLFVVMNEL